MLVPCLASLLLLVLRVSLWTQPHTPDSEFYLTLAVFGDHLTDHVANAAYYWTRVGVLVPLRLLVQMFGVDGGYAAWHFILLGVALVPSYALIRHVLGRAAAVAGALFILLNLVFLTTLGNPYVTSAVVPLLAAECALLVASALATRSRSSIFLTTFAGVTVAWVFACNQFAGLLAGVLWLVGTAFARHDVRMLVTSLAFSAWAACTTFLALVFAGSILFPSFNWWQTTRLYASALNVDAFHSDNLIWLRSNPALAVPVVLAVSAIAASVRPGNHPRHLLRLTGLLAATCIGLGVYFQFVARLGFLEFQAYAAYLWGPALVAGGASIGVLVGRSGARALCLVAVFGGLIAGAWVPTGNGHTLWPFGTLLALIAIAIVTCWVAPPRLVSSRYFFVAASALVPLAVQYLQSATRQEPGLKFNRVNYEAVLRGDDFRDSYMQDVAITRWVLDQGSLTSRYMVWAAPEPGLGGPGAMLFQGPNAVSLSFAVNPAQLNYIRTVAPSDVVLIAVSDAQVRRLQDGLGRVASQLAKPRCATFPRSDEAVEVHVCIVGVTFER